MRGVRWARSPSRSSFVDSLPAPRASERCALGFTLIIDDINAVMISAAESVPLRMTFPAWCPTNTGILMARTYQEVSPWTAATSRKRARRRSAREHLPGDDHLGDPGSR